MFGYKPKDPGRKALERATKFLNDQPDYYWTGVYTPHTGSDAGEQAVILLYCDSKRRGGVNFFYLTGKRCCDGGTFSFHEEARFTLELNVNGATRMTQDPAAASWLSEAIAIVRKEMGIRVGIYRDLKGRLWSFSHRSNLRSDTDRPGQTFVLHRDRTPEDGEHPALYRLFYESMLSAYEGVWLPRELWVVDPDPTYRYFLDEQSIDKDALRTLRRAFPEPVVNELMAQALYRIGQHFNIQTGLEDYVQAQVQVFHEAALKKREAENDPRCHYTPYPRNPHGDVQRSGDHEPAAAPGPAEG